MQAGVSNIIDTNSRGDCAHIANMLHNGSQRDGGDGDHSSDQHAYIQVLVEDGQCGFLPDNRQADPIRFCYLCCHIGTGCGINCHSHQIGYYHAQQDGHDLDHAFTPDVADHNHQNRSQRHQPVAGAAVNSGTCQSQTDGNDHRSSNDGGKEFHYLLGAENLKQPCQHQIHDAGYGHTKTRVGQRDVLTGCGNQTVCT